MYAMTGLGRVSSNADARPFELSQFAAWYLMEGIYQFMLSADMDCQCDTLLLELERLRQWDERYGGYYDAKRYEALAREIRDVRADIRRNDIWYDNQMEG